MVQVGAVGSVGSVEITSCPAPSTATHSAVDGHETPFSIAAPSITLRVLHTGVASVGSWVITAPPSLSTATQNAVPLHEIAFSA